MRLTPAQRHLILSTIRTQLGPKVRVRLFGSRLDDKARGGDLDLLVEVDEVLPNRAAQASRLTAQLQLALGDQRIDLLLIDPETPLQPVHRAARTEGVVL